MTWTGSRRACILTIAVLVMVVGAAAPAAAHGRGSESTNFQSRIVSSPVAEGVTWSVLGGDQYLSVENTTDTELVVPGYNDEPYLRIGPEGVFENRASEAAYLNADRYAEVGAMPPDVGPDQEPRWTKVSDSPSYAWHDHRIHWMSVQLPPSVVDPGRETLVNEWTVEYAYGAQPQELSGELWWMPPPSPVPWLAIGLVLTLPALLGVPAARRRSDEDPGIVDTGDPDSAAAGDPPPPPWIARLARPAAAVLFAVSLLNITHLVDDFLAVPLPLATQLIAAVQTALFIALGLAGAWLAWRGRDGAFTALGVGAGAILIGQGLLYLDVLTSSASASVFPDWLTRLAIALSVMQALPVGAVAVLGNRRIARETPDPAADAVEEVPAT